MSFIFIFVINTVIVVALILLLLLYMLNYLISMKKNELLKISTFESGFMSIGMIQSSFSIHFFVMMLMFVVFDLEIVMFLGLMIADYNSLFSFFMLMMFIFGSFYMEWWYGKLIWLI